MEFCVKPEIKVYGQEPLSSFTINIYPEEFEEEHEKSNLLYHRYQLIILKNRT